MRNEDLNPPGPISGYATVEINHFHLPRLFDSGQRCSVLQGNVSLTDEASRAVLSTGQIYTITIEMEVPESAVNLQVQMPTSCE
jgi:hypothetical protein